MDIKPELKTIIELLKPLSEYYVRINVDEVIREQDDAEKVKLVLNQWKIFKSLKDSVIIEDLINIEIKNIEKGISVYENMNPDIKSIFRPEGVRDYFLSKWDIDINYGLIGMGMVIGKSNYDYFEVYGNKEKERWGKISMKIADAVRKFKLEFEIKNRKLAYERYTKKAIEMGLNRIDAKGNAIRMIADELGESYKLVGALEVIAGSVQRNLDKYYSNNENKKEQDLYLIGNDNAVKIGVSKNVNKRLNGIQTGSHEKNKIIKIYKQKGSMEGMIHRKLAKFRKEGEWFDKECLKDEIWIELEGENQ